MTDEELKQLVANLAIFHSNFAMEQQKTESLIRELRDSQKATDKQIKELGKQIGGLGEKFGSFTEGMAFPSMRKILREQFGMEAIVEVKSHLRDEYITRLLTILKEVKNYLPEHANKKFFGILAVVDAQDSLKAQVLNNGLYYAEIHHDVFALKVPLGFQAQVF